MRVSKEFERIKKSELLQRRARDFANAQLYWTKRCAKERLNSESPTYPVNPLNVLRNISLATSAQLQNLEQTNRAIVEENRADAILGGTKLFRGQLSKGCQICIEGKWSCLYIGDHCTAKCFFCPVFRNAKKSQPTAEKRVFDSPDRYVQYLKEKKFSGMSFSGGEPLLYFDKVIHYLKSIRMELPADFYVWLYTNGDLFTDERLAELRDLGVNEIRLDLAASGFDLRRIRMAKKYIKTVTVEIPMIPEQEEILIKLLPHFESKGVNHLNLHQLSLTPHNEAALKSRGYSFIPGSNIAIFESELAILNVLRAKTNIPIHYCSAEYKNRFQSDHERLRATPRTGVRVTKRGFWRTSDKRNMSIDYLDPLSEQSVAKFSLRSAALRAVFREVFEEQKTDLKTAIQSQAKVSKNDVQTLIKIAEFEVVQ